jgi:hypothetical protein
MTLAETRFDDVARDTDRRRALVNKIMNFQVPQKQGNFVAR